MTHSLPIETPTSGGSTKKMGAHQTAAPKEISQMNSIASIAPAQHTLAFVREGFVTLTPAQMNVVLRECQYDRQRRVDKDHVKVLGELMRRGLWEKRDKLDFARLDGRLVLVNGYHRANAQVGSARDIEWTIVIHDCADEATVRSLYYKFDTNIRARTDANVVQGVDFAKTHGISATMASVLFGAAPVIAAGLASGARMEAQESLFARKIMDDRLAIAEQFAPAARLFEKVIVPAPHVVKRKLLNKTTASVALVTLRHHPDLASEFWGGVAANDGLRRGDPRATFLQDLLARNFHSGSVQQGVATPAIAWNAFWERRDIKIIKVMGGRTISLLGTPYTVRT